jgi:hypothetical protein
MAQSLKFTLEVRGLDIPEKAQAEISKALNQTLMHKLGELDLIVESSKGAAPAAAAGSIIASKNLINGGLLLQLLSQDLLKVVRQVEAQNNIPNSPGAVHFTIPQL